MFSSLRELFSVWGPLPRENCVARKTVKLEHKAICAEHNFLIRNYGFYGDF